MLDGYEVIVAIYELYLAHQKAEIKNTPESNPWHAVLAKDIAFAEKKLAEIRKWKDFTYPRLVDRIK